MTKRKRSLPYRRKGRMFTEKQWYHSKLHESTEKSYSAYKKAYRKKFKKKK